MNNTQLLIDAANPLFRFSMKAVPCDPSGYYFPKWSSAQSLTVIATNRKEAEEKAEAMLGKNERRWPWAFRFSSIDEIEPSAAAQSQEKGHV